METLNKFLRRKLSKDLEDIVLSLCNACSLIDTHISNVERNKQNSDIENFSGDIQKKIDIICNNILYSSLVGCGKASSIISEENQKIIRLKSSIKDRYLVAFDPLDGSSNIEYDGGMGTIFGIYKEDGDYPSGRDILCAGYALYSNSTVLVLSFQDCVYHFSLNRRNKVFYKNEDNVVIPNESKKIFSSNIGNYNLWSQEDKNFCNYILDQRYKFRNSGCMVMDVHRILFTGGIFMYPSDTKNVSGKLRMLYECIPLSFIVENANGLSSSGTTRILDLLPRSIHQKCPIYIGCKRDVILLKNFHRKIQLNNFSFIIESYSGSGEDELTVKQGETVKDYQILSDNSWSRVVTEDGENGIIPTRCLSI
jgi:fructose-1,6-bisphosphatase I